MNNSKISWVIILINHKPKNEWLWMIFYKEPLFAGIDIVTNSGINEDNEQQMQNHFDVKFK